MKTSTVRFAKISGAFSLILFFCVLRACGEPECILLVGSSGNNSVLAYDGHTGAFIRSFVSAGSGGLSVVGGFAFGPDGNFYVDSSRTHSVLRYNGTTGEFMDIFVASGSGGLNWPNGL